MSSGPICTCAEKEKPFQQRDWVVTSRLCNYSAFNGYRYTPSEWSEVRCLQCGCRWRTKAQYVARLRDPRSELRWVQKREGGYWTDEPESS